MAASVSYLQGLQNLTRAVTKRLEIIQTIFFFVQTIITIFLLGCSCFTIVLVSGIQQSESAITIHISPISSTLAQLVNNPPAMQETVVQFLAQEDPLEKG